jgi:ferritin-like metal-binding protein YciE
MAKISNPRDLRLQLLGELLFVERRLEGEVLAELAGAVHDEELAALLRDHRAETTVHARRLETAFRRLEAAPSANLSRPFESAVAAHGELAPSILEPVLADLFHAQAALHTEHWEVAAYRTVLALAPAEVRELLHPSLSEEGHAEAGLLQAIDRLAGAR